MYDARQRAILAGLGIPLWIPKLLGARKQHAASTIIWRDQPGLDQLGISIPQTLQVANVAAQQETSVVPIENQSSVARQAVPEQSAKVADVTVSNPIIAPMPLPGADVAVHPADSLSSQPLLRFSVQAVEINHWILLVDEQTLQSTEVRQLWGNICAAFAKTEQLRFNWPLADGLRWQHPQGAKAALNGFLFRLGMDKRIGLMGQLQDDVMPDRIERLPTLQELIEQPLKKRSLWQLLKQQ